MTYLSEHDTQGGRGAFAGCTTLESIKLPNSIKILKPESFAECSSLSSIGDTRYIQEIRHNVFRNCTNLIGDFDFSGLTSTMIGYQAFRNAGITKIVSLGETLTLQGSNNGDTGVFSKCTNLEYINLTKVNRLENWIFSGCSNLKEIIGLDKVAYIGSYVFYNCTSLSFEDLQLHNLETLGQNAFSGVKIRKLNISKVKTLPDGLNADTYGDKNVLEEIVLSEEVTAFPRYCFQGYNNLKKINIPSGVTSFGEAVFTGTKIEGDVYLSDITSIGSRAFDGTNISSLSAPSLETIGGQVNGRGVFDGCSNLTTIDIPSIQTIGSYAFRNCLISGSITINASTISDSAFIGNKIEELYLPNIVNLPSTTVNGGAFANNKLLRKVDIGSNCTAIGRGDFALCSSLETFICRSTIPPTLNSQAFQDSNSTFVIYVHDSSVTAYREASGWSAYASRIKPLSDYVE